MTILKKLFILLSVPIILIPLFSFKSSAKNENLLSPALAVITNDLQIKKSGLVNTPISFNSEDFGNYLKTGKIGSLKITSLPSEFEGKLYLGESTVIANQTIKQKDINKLSFVPASDNVKKTTFYFSSDSLSCNASIKCSLYLLPEFNSSPTVSIQSVSQADTVTAPQNIMIYSKLSGDDPDGDRLEFDITSLPSHGILSFIDQATGEYTYTPAFNYTGNDSFNYVVYDEYGNRSDEVTVNIKITKTDGIFFFDMLRHKDHAAAVSAASSGIIKGKLINGKKCFSPDSPLTKAEFLSMVLKSAGVDANSVNVQDTPFSDEHNIPASLKKFVAYAAKKGYISGTKTDSGVYFYPNSYITGSEAASFIGAVLNAVEPTSGFLNDINKNEADNTEILVSVLSEMGIIDRTSFDFNTLDKNLSRATAADIFCNIKKYIE